MVAELPPPCASCGALGADPGRRHLCGRCYADGPTRSCFDSASHRVADPPVPRVEVNEYVQVPLTVTTGGGRPRDALAPARSIRRPGKPDPAADDAALLDAIDRLTAGGEYVAVATGLPAAGRGPAARLARLTDTRGEAVARRLIAAGLVVALPVRRHGRGGNRQQGGLRRTG